MVEQWLESALAQHPVGWLATLVTAGLDLDRSAGAVDLARNQLVEAPAGRGSPRDRPDVLRALPASRSGGAAAWYGHAAVGFWQRPVAASDSGGAAGAAGQPSAANLARAAARRASERARTSGRPTWRSTAVIGSCWLRPSTRSPNRSSSPRSTQAGLEGLRPRKFRWRCAERSWPFRNLSCRCSPVCRRPSPSQSPRGARPPMYRGGEKSATKWLQTGVDCNRKVRTALLPQAPSRITRND